MASANSELPIYPLTLATTSLFSTGFFSGPHPWHVEVPRLGVEPEPQLLAYTLSTATQDLSHVCNLSRQRQTLNPLSKVRNRTFILMDNNQVFFTLSHESDRDGVGTNSSPNKGP